jgi:hypothetical protein
MAPQDPEFPLVRLEHEISRKSLDVSQHCPGKVLGLRPVGYGGMCSVSNGRYNEYMPVDLPILSDWIASVCNLAAFILLCGALTGGITALRRRQGSIRYCDTVITRFPLERRQPFFKPIRHSPAYFSSTPTTLRLITRDWTRDLHRLKPAG